MVKYVMEVLRPFQYCTLWISKRHTVSLHQVINLYNAMFHHMDGVMPALAKKKTQWKEDLYFAVKVGCIEAVQIFCQSDSNNLSAFHFSAYHSSFPEVAIV